MAEISTSNIIVGMADAKVGKAPSTIVTNLGSCIGVCLYSASHKVGGMLHLMLGYAKNKGPEEIKLAKYADTGIPHLLHLLKKAYNIDPSDCVAKIFGGGNIIKSITNEIGAQNEQAVRKFLKEYGIRIIAAKTGGDKGYRISFDLSTGKVRCQIFGQSTEDF